MSSIFLNGEGITIRRANDTWEDAKRFRRPEPLFDEFWCDGELALMFGPPSSGKSVFAVQLGDSLARGSGLPGFRRPRGRRRVLYVDLQHTDEQFQMRSRRGEYPMRTYWQFRPRHMSDPVVNAKDNHPRHRFAFSLFRDRPPAGADLCDWLRACISAHKIQAVIVDDLSALKNTHDGVRESLQVMRGLREIRDQLGTSILVLADSAPPAKGVAVGEKDLGRSRVLCTVADSVFAIGQNYRDAEDRYFIQTRLRRAPIFWTIKNAPVATIDRYKRRLLTFEFDDRFTDAFDEKRRRLICEVVRLAEKEGKTFREIGAALGISKSWACTLYRRWIPSMGDDPGSEPAAIAVKNAERANDHEKSEDIVHRYDQHETDPDDARRYGFLDDENEDDEFDTADRPHKDRAGEAADFEAGRDDLHIEDATLERSNADITSNKTHRRIRDLEHDIDGYGRPIYVESRQEHDRKPIVWYHQDKNGNFIRHERGTFGIKLNNVGQPA